jgi:phosphopentomutase
MAARLLLVMDSVGCGGAPDAADFGDDGANTWGHIALACAEGRAEDGPQRAAAGADPGAARARAGDPPRLGARDRAAGNHRGPLGRRDRGLRGKDTPSGHWELAGVPVPWEWHYFPARSRRSRSRSPGRWSRAPGCRGCSATATPRACRSWEWGEEHLATGKPIVYTSADSVLQIAAHEERFGLERLYAVCRTPPRSCIRCGSAG